jgi:hypothetical protein
LQKQRSKLELFKKLFTGSDHAQTMDNGFVDVGGIEDFPVQNGVGSSNPQLQMSPKMNKEIAIDRIKEERTNADGEHEFLVKFKPVKETWVKATEVKKYPDLVQAFQVK